MNGKKIIGGLLFVLLLAAAGAALYFWKTGFDFKNLKSWELLKSNLAKQIDSSYKKEPAKDPLLIKVELAPFSAITKNKVKEIALTSKIAAIPFKSFLPSSITPISDQESPLLKDTVELPVNLLAGRFKAWEDKTLVITHGNGQETKIKMPADAQGRVWLVEESNIWVLASFLDKLRSDGVLSKYLLKDTLVLVTNILQKDDGINGRWLVLFN